MSCTRGAVCAAVVAGALLGAGCAASARVSPSLAAEMRGRVQREYVEPLRAGDSARWAQVFAEDALAYHDGPPALRGREAIRAFGASIAQHFEIRRFDVVVDEVRRNGEWVLTAGHYSALFAPHSTDAYAGASGPRAGKFLFLWEHRAGRWQIIMDMGNSTDAPSAAQP